MTTLSRVFIDSGAFLALVDPRDAYHAEAVEFYRSLPGRSERMTSWAVVSECYTWLLYHVNGVRARRWLGDIGDAEDQGRLHVIYPDPSLDLQTRRILQRFEDQQLSYTDALTLAILQMHSGIAAIFAFDHHMALAGVPVRPGTLGR